MPEELVVENVAPVVRDLERARDIRNVGDFQKELECEVMMIPIFWSVDTLDWSTRNADRLVDQVVSEAEENDIILMHDSYGSTVKAALRIVDLLQAEGYEFVTADELILE